MEIIIMGMFTFVLTVYLLAKRYNNKIRIEDLEKENRRLGVRIGSMTDAKFRVRELHIRDLETEHSMRVGFQKENKQLRADIDCFRAELGLGPRTNKLSDY